MSEDIEKEKWVNVLSKNVKSFGKTPVQVNIYITKGAEQPPKKVSNWVEHVKGMAKELGINYSQAMKDPRVKEQYKINPRTEEKGIYNSQFNDLFNKINENNSAVPTIDKIMNTAKGKKLRDRGEVFGEAYDLMRKLKKAEKENKKADEDVFNKIMESNLGISFNQEKGKKIKDKKKNYTNLLNRIEQSNF